MKCASCGSADVAVRRDEAVYCSRCVVARDWHEVIAIAQQTAPVAEADRTDDEDERVPVDVGAGGGLGAPRMPADPFG